ncbi:hypothetical protein GCM10027569_27650 [Flindersiella endophytica]
MEPTERPTFLAHALTLSALHGTKPWPDGGHPLPDEQVGGDRPLLSSVVQDGIESHHFTPEPATGVPELSDEIAAAAGARTPERLATLHDQLAARRAMRVVDELLDELRDRDLPAANLRLLARTLCETGTHREAVKLAIAVLGTVADDRDRELLLLLGALEEFTLFAAVALHNSQEDRHRAVFELAQRVENWGRIHTVERLRGAPDQDIKAWLLREGFRNGIMHEYTAHLAATTGDLYDALLDEHVDDALLDGAGAILAALATGGPAEGLRHYPDGLAATHRYLDLIAGAAPTLDRLAEIQRLNRLLGEPNETLPWQEPERHAVAARLDALLARTIWRQVARDGLANPVGPYGFDQALSCASDLGIPIHDAAIAQLESHPFNAYVWQTLFGATPAEQVQELVRFGKEYEADRALAAVVWQLRDFPGVGLRLIKTALRNRTPRARWSAVRTLTAWPEGTLDATAIGEIRHVLRHEPDEELVGEAAERLAGWHSAGSA